MNKYSQTKTFSIVAEKLHFPSSLSYSTASRTIKLRDYQEDAIESVKRAIARGIRRPAVVLATGGGKTVVFSHLIKQLNPNSPGRGNKTLILAHKEELIKQATDMVRLINPDLKVDIDMRKHKPSNDADVVVASVPTLIRMTRLQRYNPQEFKTIILDECHHATANSWIKILKYFQADSKKSDIHVLGFTATMERTDKKELGSVFDEIVFQRGLLEMIKNKELADIKFSTIETNIDLSSVATRFNDYVISGLSKIMANHETNLMLALSYIELRKKFDFKSTLIFCVDIAHCQTLCGVLQKEGINAQYVTGNTVKYERVKLIEDFKNGIIEVLCNVMVFTEGTDIPNIDSLFLARPTKSRPLLVQMLGRGLRLHKSKSYCHVIDLNGSYKSGVQSIPNLFALPPTYKIDGKSFTQLMEEIKEIDANDDSSKGDDKDLKELRAEINRRKEEKSISDTLKELKLNEKVILSFETFSSYIELENMYNKKQKSMIQISQQISQSKLHWIRIDYDSWAYQINNSDFFYIQLQSKGEILLFKLTINRFTTREQKFFSKYKCGNHRIISHLCSNKNIQEILEQAETSKHSTEDKAITYFRGDNTISENQLKYIIAKLGKKVSSMHSNNSTAINNFKKGLKLLNKTRASNLIFALNISVNSLWVKYEMNNILGMDDSMRSSLKRIQANALKNSTDAYNGL